MLIVLDSNAEKVEGTLEGKKVGVAQHRLWLTNLKRIKTSFWALVFTNILVFIELLDLPQKLVHTYLIQKLVHLLYFKDPFYVCCNLHDNYSILERVEDIF